jgi:hypothetical protein
MSTQHPAAICVEDGVPMVDDVDCWRCPVCNQARAKRAGRPCRRRR